jgi:hypothetical protein
MTVRFKEGSDLASNNPFAKASPPKVEACLPVVFERVNIPRVFLH